MKGMPSRDWDDAFANMAHIEGSDAFLQQWTAAASAYRASDVWVEEFSYGNLPRERFDIIWPVAKPIGLAVLVHGGYWMRTDKSIWTDLAEGARAKGWAVCMPSYSLAPHVSICEITKQIGQAIIAAAQKIDGPIRLAGHSAGGHLVTRMICQDSPLNDVLLQRIQHCLSISGLHDLRPLLHTKMNNTLQLNMAEASSESAALQLPFGNPSLTAWVGGNERPEFIRQAQLIVQMWDGLDANTRCVIDAKHNHFSVIEGLKSADSEITNAFVG